MLRHLQVFSVAAVIALVATSVRAEDAKPAAAPDKAAASDRATQLQEKIVNAYKQTKQYQSEVAFEMAQKVGRWTTLQRGIFTVRLDRDNNRLLIDTPNYSLVYNDGKLKLKAEEIAARHLAVDAPTLDYGALSEQVPFIGKPPLPDVALLLSDSPFKALGNGSVTSKKAVDPDPADPQKREGLELTIPIGKVMLRVDPVSSLVTNVRIDLDAAVAGGKPSDAVVLTYDIKVNTQNKAIDAKQFAFDAGSTMAAASLQEWATGRAAAKEPAHPLQGQNAPAISLKLLDGKAYKLADEKADVIVLDFWATWCGPCRKGLPKLQAVYDWAKKENKSVAIYTVNVREEIDKINEFWTGAKFTMPVLLDAEGTVSDAYGVEGIPQTVIISKGKVQHVHIGYREDMDSLIKKQVEALLVKPAGT